jgi:hypothetical protein
MRRTFVLNVQHPQITRVLSSLGLFLAPRALSQFSECKLLISIGISRSTPQLSLFELAQRHLVGVADQWYTSF